MTYDAVLEEQFKKFGIENPEEIRSTVEKYLTPDEKWEIVGKFFKQKAVDDGKVTVDNVNKMVIVNFSTAGKAKKFAEMPSEGLPAFARQWVRENKEEDWKKFDIYFNLGITYDDKDPKANKRVMIWCEK